MEKYMNMLLLPQKCMNIPVVVSNLKSSVLRKLQALAPGCVAPAAAAAFLS